MTLTINTCKDHVRAVLGGEPLSLYSGAFIANTVGRWLENARSWEWLTRATTTLDAVSGQSWLAIPEVRGITKIVPTQSLTTSFELTSMEEIIRMREGNTGTGLVTYGALNFHAVSGSAPAQRIEIWPTPSANGIAAYTMHYHATWTDLDDDNATIPIPRYMEQLFLMACVEWAKGMEEYASEEQRGGSGYDRLERLRATHLFQAAAVRDGSVQRDLGQLTGGGGDNLQRGYTWMDFPTFGDWGS